MLSNINLEITPVEEATEAILDFINTCFFDDLQDSLEDTQLEDDIGQFLNSLRQDLYCLIEFPYVDKVYRDSYYNYFSSKHFNYKRDCIRVSFFDGEVSLEDFLTPSKHEGLKEKFLGFTVLRPLSHTIFGRSIMSPDAFKNLQASACKFRQNVLVFGVKMDVYGFPHSSQDGETITCAETTIWALMEYFGNRYAEYQPTLPSKITKALERFSFQRQLPSNGLTMDQISFALKEFGFGTRIYSKDSHGETFNYIIDYYIESGIPVVVGLESDNYGHAIVAAGKQYLEKINWKKIGTHKEKINDTEVEYIEASSIPARYLIQDDNFTPYQLIDLNKPGEHYPRWSECHDYHIDSIVVPLYPKIYLEAYVAKELMLQIITDAYFGYKYEEPWVFRFFLASSRSFKNHVSQIEEMEDELKQNILITSMPKFIWCGEIYSKQGFENNEAQGLVILDATEANRESVDALLFAGYPDRCINLADNKLIVIERGFEKYRYFSNLK